MLKRFAIFALIALTVLLVLPVQPVQIVEAATLDVCSTCTYTTPAAAVAAASAGDTISIAAGTYPVSTQILVNKSLTIIGAGPGSTILQATGPIATWTGMFTIDGGANLDISNLTMDGSGQAVFAALHWEEGSGTADNLEIKNIRSSTYLGIAISVGGHGGTGVTNKTNNVTVSNTTFSNIYRIGVLFKGSGVTGVVNGITYNGKGAVDGLDYGVEVSAGAVVDIMNSTLTNCRAVASVDGSTSAGILVTTAYGGGTTANISGNTLDNNSTGVLVGYGTSDSSTVVAASDNVIYGNDTGIYSRSTVTVNAANNCWGCPSGPGTGYCDTIKVDETIPGAAITTEPFLVCDLMPKEESTGPAWGDPFPCDTMEFVGGWGIFSEGTPEWTSFTVPEPPAGYAYANQLAHTGWCDVFTISEQHSPLPVTACWPGTAPAVGLYHDIPGDPQHGRTWAIIPTTQEGANVCASLPHFGGVALLTGGSSVGTMVQDPAAQEAPAVLDQSMPAGTPVNCMVTTTDRVNLRETPNGDVITRVPYNVTLTATAESNGWYQVDWLGQMGWISADYAAAVCQ